MYGLWDTSGIDEENRKRADEFARLAALPRDREPVVGDRVLFAAGVVGRGYAWVRKEAVVTEATQNAVKVEFPGYGDKMQTEWLDRALITDVLDAKSEERA